MVECPNCEYPNCKERSFSYHPVKNGVFLDTSKMVTVKEYTCPRCGYWGIENTTNSV